MYEDFVLYIQKHGDEMNACMHAWNYKIRFPNHILERYLLPCSLHPLQTNTQIKCQSDSVSRYVYPTFKCQVLLHLEINETPCSNWHLRFPLKKIEEDGIHKNEYSRCGKQCERPHTVQATYSTPHSYPRSIYHPFRKRNLWTFCFIIFLSPTLLAFIYSIELKHWKSIR